MPESYCPTHAGGCPGSFMNVSTIGIQMITAHTGSGPQQDMPEPANDNVVEKKHASSETVTSNLPPPPPGMGKFVDKVV